MPLYIKNTHVYYYRKKPRFCQGHQKYLYHDLYVLLMISQYRERLRKPAPRKD